MTVQLNTLEERQENVSPVLDTETKQFLSDMQATLRGERHGIIGPWQYSSSHSNKDPVRGAYLWETFLKASLDYYPLPNETRLIQSRAGDLIQDKSTPVVLVDIGPGSTQAVINKTIPVKRHFENVVMYCPVDKCEDYLISSANVLNDEQQGIPIKAYHVDYTQDEINIPHKGRVVALFFGGTIGNFEGHPNEGLPEDKVVEYLKSVKKIIGSDGTLMITHDANQDETSILRSYLHPLQVAFGSNIMHRVKRDLPVYGDFDPDAWHYEPVWHEKNHQLCHTILCDRDQTFWLGQERFKIHAGERFILNNSFKYPVHKMKEWASLAGFGEQAHVMDHQGRQALHALHC